HAKRMGTRSWQDDALVVEQRVASECGMDGERCAPQHRLTVHGVRPRYAARGDSTMAKVQGGWEMGRRGLGPCNRDRDSLGGEEYRKLQGTVHRVSLCGHITLVGAGQSSRS